MANVNPKDFPLADATTGAETFPVYQGGWKTITLHTLKEFMRMNQVIFYDKVSQTIAYVCKAAVGSDPATPVWQIKRINPTDPNAPILYAEGNQGFIHIRNNRTNLEYS